MLRAADFTRDQGGSFTATDRSEEAKLKPRQFDLEAFRARKRARRALCLLILLADSLALITAFLISGTVRFGSLVNDQVMSTIGIVMPVYVLVGLNTHIFNGARLTENDRGIREALQCFIVALSAVALAVFFLKVSLDFSRAIFGIGAALGLALLSVTRATLGGAVARRFGGTIINVLVIADGVAAPPSKGGLTLDATMMGLAPRLDDPVILDRLGRIVDCADRVIIVCAPERRALWATALKGADVDAEVLAPELDDLGPVGFGTHEGHSTLRVASGPLGIVDRTVKRCLDLLLVLMSAPLTLPLMAIIAIAIRLESKGPILFTQDRVGLGNRLFRVYKFRSMYADTLDGRGTRSTSRGDERVTRVGKIIRTTSMDELPQLFNVLSGAMSIVGPRPHALGSRADDRLFWDIDFKYWHRHAVKPGMTGLAQIRGFRGTMERESDLKDRLQADLEYLAGWSIWRDVAIILATFRVLVHKNAF